MVITPARMVVNYNRQVGCMRDVDIRSTGGILVPDENGVDDDRSGDGGRSVLYEVRARASKRERERRTSIS